MNPRAAWRFSRRIDLSCPCSLSCPTPTSLTSRRGFRSSLAPRAPTPKFAPRWGSRQTQKPASLSPAEQALRNSLVAKSQPAPEPEPPRKPKARSQFPSRTRVDKDPNRATDPSAEQPRPSSRDPAAVAAAKRNRSSHRSRPVAQHVRHNDDWACPGCKAHVFSRHETCPFCKTARPESPLNTVEPEQQGSGWDCPTCRTHVLEERNVCFKCGTNRALAPSFASPLREENNKFRELGRSFLSEMEGKEKTPDVKDSGETPEAESKIDKKDQWSWDMSSLERLEEATETENMSQKTSKHRDSRKQRPTKDNDDFDVEEHQRRREERKKLLRKKAEKKKAKEAPAPLYLPEFISVSNLADVINVRPAQFVQRMEDMGFEDITYSHVLDAETAGLVVTEFNFEPIFETATDELEAAPVPEDTSVLPPRPPVVTIMGHVDHGKTTILDWLRKSSVAASEHGGITQHIGAFSVAMPSGKTITFLDTPGHSAFLEMRRRGADVTDIVVLVVAADDSVKPQTIEAIKHATQAKVPIIVAISKIDKEGRNPDRVKQDLAMHGVNVEDYGGDVQAIPVSGKTGQGMIDLEEAIVALSEMLDHRADIHGNVEGWVIETTTKTYGRVTSALIRRGTLRPGDVIVAGTTWARVRTLRNEAGVSVNEATPGMPVEIDGWREQPTAGTEMLQAPSEQKAKDVVAYRQERSETKKMGQDIVAINEARRDLLEKRKAEAEAEESESEEPTSVPEEPTGPKAINFVVKADVDGSAEAVLNSIAAIGNNEVYANVIRSGVGPVAEFDIEHAASARGHVISFNMPIDASTMRMAELQGVNLMDHNIIYKLIDDVKDILSKHLPPSITKRVTGEAEVRQVFEVTLKGRAKTAIAGSRVRNGTMNRNRKVRVIRGDETIYDGTISSLKNVKKDVTEMRKDTECGIGFDDWADFAVGDHIQCYEEIFEKRYL